MTVQHSDLKTNIHLKGVFNESQAKQLNSDFKGKVRINEDNPESGKKGKASTWPICPSFPCDGHAYLQSGGNFDDE